jgi:hypothetical protein
MHMKITMKLCSVAMQSTCSAMVDRSLGQKACSHAINLLGYPVSLTRSEKAGIHRIVKGSEGDAGRRDIFIED